MLAATAGGASAQAWSFEPRVGAVAGSELYADAGVSGGDAVTVSAGAAPEVGAAARTALDASWRLDVEVHFAMGNVRADGPDGDRTTSDLRVYGGAVLLRRTFGGLEAAAGAGAVKYDAPDARAWADGASLRPTARLGLALPFRVRGRMLRAEATARVHRHQTTALEAAGAAPATVVRLGAHLGVELGGVR